MRNNQEWWFNGCIEFWIFSFFSALVFRFSLLFILQHQKIPILPSELIVYILTSSWCSGVQFFHQNRTIPFWAFSNNASSTIWTNAETPTCLLVSFPKIVFLINTRAILQTFIVEMRMFFFKEFIAHFLKEAKWNLTEHASKTRGSKVASRL